MTSTGILQGVQHPLPERPVFLVTQQALYNFASNLLKAYGTDKVDIEIVAFDPGVRFAACNNIISNMAKTRVMSRRSTRMPFGSGRARSVSWN